MPGFQFGTGIGTIVGDTPADNGGTVGDVLGPDSTAGQATLLAAIGFVILFVALPKGGGALGRIGGVAQFLLGIAAATWVTNYVARMYAARHPDGPLAGGLRFNA